MRGNASTFLIRFLPLSPFCSLVALPPACLAHSTAVWVLFAKIFNRSFAWLVFLQKTIFFFSVRRLPACTYSQKLKARDSIKYIHTKTQKTGLLYNYFFQWKKSGFAVCWFNTFSEPSTSSSSFVICLFVWMLWCWCWSKVWIREERKKKPTRRICDAGFSHTWAKRWAHQSQNPFIGMKS